MSASKEDWVAAKSLVREWLMEKGVALTGVNGKASRSTVNRFKLDLQRRIVTVLAAERERAARIAETPYGDDVQAMAGDEPRAVGIKIARAIREGKPQE